MVKTGPADGSSWGRNLTQKKNLSNRIIQLQGEGSEQRILAVLASQHCQLAPWPRERRPRRDIHQSRGQQGNRPATDKCHQHGETVSGSDGLMQGEEVRNMLWLTLECLNAPGLVSHILLHISLLCLKLQSPVQIRQCNQGHGSGIQTIAIE